MGLLQLSVEIAGVVYEVILSFIQGGSTVGKQRVILVINSSKVFDILYTLVSGLASRIGGRSFSPLLGPRCFYFAVCILINLSIARHFIDEKRALPSRGPLFGSRYSKAIGIYCLPTKKIEEEEANTKVGSK